jgi:hypothetical protein
MRKVVSVMFMLMVGALVADTDSEPSLEAKIRSLIDENMMTGLSVVFVKGDRVVYQQPFGYRATRRVL